MPKKNGKNIRMRCDVNCPRSVRFTTPDISWENGMTLKMPDTTRSSIRVLDLEKLQPAESKGKRRSKKVSDADECDASVIPDTFIPSTSCTRHYSNDRSSTDYYRVGWSAHVRIKPQSVQHPQFSENPSHSDTCAAGYRERQSWRVRPAEE